MSDIRKILNTLTEMTSGSVASVSMPLTTQRRQDHVDENDAKSQSHDVLEYGNWENSALTTSKKLKQTRSKAKKLVKKIYGEAVAAESMDGVAPSTKMFTSEGKTKNPVAKAAQRVAKGSGKHKNPAKVLPRKAKHKKMYEEEITEQDLIISPVIRRGRDRDLISRDHSRIDREVEMARGDVHQAQQNAAKILAMIQDRSEQEGLEGWVQEKIIKASDYLNTVREYLENREQEQGVAEGSDELYQKSIRKYTQRVAHDYLGGGNEHVYGANKFDSEMFGVDPKQAKQDFDRLFPEFVKKLQGVAEGSDQFLVYISVDRVEAFEDWMNSEGLETNVPKTDEGTYVVYDYSNADHRSKMYAGEWNEKKGVAEGFSDVVKGIKRSIKGKEHPDVIASKHAGRAMGHYNQGDIAAGDKETERYVKTRDIHLKAKGVAEGSDQELVRRQVSYWDQVAKEKREEERKARRAKKAEYEETPAGKAEKYWSQKGVAEDLDSNQKSVGQLGPTEKIGKRGTRGRLVGGN